MRSLMQNLMSAFGAGAFGGLVNSFAVVLAGQSGWTAAAQVRIAPDLTPAFLYPRIVWGGLWAFSFLLWNPAQDPVKRGLILSLLPASFQLFYVFPTLAGKGMLGVELGAMTPIFVLAFNAIWGLAAAWAYKQSQ